MYCRGMAICNHSTGNSITHKKDGCKYCIRLFFMAVCKFLFHETYCNGSIIKLVDQDKRAIGGVYAVRVCQYRGSCF